MKRIFKILFLLLAATAGLNSYAADKDEITLTVTSDGATKDEAIKNALRTAIEQAYGAFVSANTTILNDELVKDEIVTVSNGSIKEYKEIASAQIENGSYSVTLSATVSLPHLISYAKNHGSECEFAGNTFGMEIRLFNLQKENELKAISNLIPAVRHLCRTTMAWQIKVDEPYILNANGKFNYDTWHSLSIKSDEVNNLLQNIPNLTDSVFNEHEELCVVHFTLSWERIGLKNQVAQFLYESLSKIGLDRRSYLDKMKKGCEVSSFTRWRLWCCSDDDPSILEDEFNGYYWFRNNEKSMVKAITEINNAILEEKLKFLISDNNGSSDFHAGDFISLISDWKQNDWKNLDAYNAKTEIYKIPYANMCFTKTGTDNYYWGINGTGLFKNLFAIYPRDRYRSGSLYAFENHEYTYPLDIYNSSNNNEWSFSIYVIVPMSEIGKYSSFKIEPK